MLIYEGYGIEKVDAINFRVFKIGESAPETVVRKGVTYHGDLKSALSKMRNILNNDKYHNSFITIEAAIKKIQDTDTAFLAALDRLTTKKFILALEDTEAMVKLST